ncbi:MAG: hypothetical protein MJ137_02625 [Clostridia bacterium]|nr:hypothetical protein [Clostridia bacterium]
MALELYDLYLEMDDGTELLISDYKNGWLPNNISLSSTYGNPIKTVKGDYSYVINHFEEYYYQIDLACRKYIGSPFMTFEHSLHDTKMHRLLSLAFNDTVTPSQYELFKEYSTIIKRNNASGIYLFKDYDVGLLLINNIAIVVSKAALLFSSIRFFRLNSVQII